MPYGSGPPLDSGLLGRFAPQRVEKHKCRAEFGRTAKLYGFERFGYIKADPTQSIRIPKQGKRLPQILTVDETDLLLSSIDPSTPLGMRDRAIFELLYATGIRLSELVGLNVDGGIWTWVMSVSMGKGAGEDRPAW